MLKRTDQGSIKHRANEALANLREAMTRYAEGRDTNLCVGQFLDDEGRAEVQNGIYGMSAWLTMSQDQAGITVVDKLALSCRQRLQAAVTATDGSKHSQELNEVVPKIALALEALGQQQAAAAEATLLRDRLASAQRNGGWGPLVNSATQNQVITALVLRSILKDPSLSEQRRRAVEYLQRSFEKVSNPYEQLYVLSAIQLAKGPESTIDARVAIRKSIRKIFKEVRANPTKFTNPTILDFHDSGRTRYFRLQTELVLAEALTLLTPSSPTYLRAHTGSRILSAVCKNLQNRHFDTDLSGHRASIGSCFATNRLLKEIAGRNDSWAPEWLATIGAWFACAAAFGVNFTYNVIVFAFCAIGAIVAFHEDATAIGSALVGAALKTLLDAGKSISVTYRGGAE